jgi:hypothetical protein
MMERGVTCEHTLTLPYYASKHARNLWDFGNVFNKDFKKRIQYLITKQIAGT